MIATMPASVCASVRRSRSSENANDCSAEIAGEFLLYTLSLGAGEIYLSATPMDSVAPPQMLLRCVDNTTGWGTVSKLMRAMEEHRIRSLERPIVINGFAADGSDSWIIV